VDETTARLIKSEVSDGIIALDYTPEALSILKSKKKGTYIILKINPSALQKEESWTDINIREIGSLAITQDNNTYKTDFSTLTNCVTKNKHITEDEKIDLIIANISLKYAQSNNVAYAYQGQLIGLAAGQQNRVDCVRLAGNKSQKWILMQHPKTLEFKQNIKSTLKRQDKINELVKYITADYQTVLKDWETYYIKKPEELTQDEKNKFIGNFKISMASDAFFPFRDNIDVAATYNVKNILQPGGSVADDSVIKACNENNMVMMMSGYRMFYH